MSQLSEKWLQNIAKESLKLPPLNPIVCNMLLSIIEIHIKRIIQQASKFQKHSKSRTLTVEDINSALIMNKIEPLYGLSAPPHPITMSDNQSTSSSKLLTKQFSKLINLVEFGKGTTLPPCPLKPEVSLHWLVVHGQQPLTSDNPSVMIISNTDSSISSSTTENQLPLVLPKELQHLYARITGVILTASESFSSPGLVAAMKVLRTDTGIQELTPYFSRFFYQQIRSNTKRLPLLTTIIKATKSLLSNPHINLEFHLQQLLPAVFTCIVASKLSTLPTDDHWSLRVLAAEVIALINSKYNTQYPDLHARICKTYVDALDKGGGGGDTTSNTSTSNSTKTKAFGTLYGGLVGLSSMGVNVIRLLLLPNLIHLEQILVLTKTSSSKPLLPQIIIPTPTTITTTTKDTTTTTTTTTTTMIIEGTASSSINNIDNGIQHSQELQDGIATITSSSSSALTGITTSCTISSALVGTKHMLVSDTYTSSNIISNTTGISSSSTAVKKRKELGSDNIQTNHSYYNKDMLYQQYQINTEVHMCRHALLELLGKYIIHITKLFEYEIISNRNNPTINTTTSTQSKLSRKVTRNNKITSNSSSQVNVEEKNSDKINNKTNSTLPLCDLEEMLVPYYVSASKQDYYCRLLI